MTRIKERLAKLRGINLSERGDRAFLGGVLKAALILLIAWAFARWWLGRRYELLVALSYFAALTSVLTVTLSGYVAKLRARLRAIQED